ncbi:replication initiation protein [Macrococcus bovicus]|uniref:replication initiation protein n=1 Tax=Macrococcus bovicus TaxID=69968 RepID=UPI0025A67C0C|nr:replication initiation protein [Macrococcus bovicus]WJP96698.1 replication initiation protein [Macrococcus bovicus]
MDEKFINTSELKVGGNLDVVKYHNDLNTVVMRKWTAEEMNFFFSIIAKMKNKGTDEVVFNTDELKELVNYDPKKPERWAKTMKNVADKITDLKYKESTKSSYVVMPLFQYFKVDLDERKVTVQVTSRFEYILNRLNINFTYYKLEDFIEIRSVYAKNMYRKIKQFKKQGKLIFSIEELKKSLDMPEYYKTSEIDRLVIKQLQKELPDLIPGFSVKKLKSRKRGTPVVGYEFTWQAEQTGKFKDFSKKKATDPKEVSYEKTPDWLGKEQQNTEMSEEDKQKADELRKKIAEFQGQTIIDEFTE